MDHQRHKIITSLCLGDKYDDVHIWLDEGFEAASKNGKPFSHWIERHNLKAITEKYGEGTPKGIAAILHVLCDWLSHCGIFYIPETPEDVKTKLLDWGKEGIV